MNTINPVFASTLAAFSGQSHHAKPRKVLVDIDHFDVQIKTLDANPNGPAEWRYVSPSDQVIKTAAERVLDRHAGEVEAEVIRLIEGGAL